jgi:16S rRNA C1402 N4-methylase RsmH
MLAQAQVRASKGAAKALREKMQGAFGTAGHKKGDLRRFSQATSVGFDRDKFMMSERMKEMITRDGRTRQKETKFSKMVADLDDRESRLQVRICSLHFVPPTALILR